MQYVLEKNLRIMLDLLTYFHRLGATDYSTHLEPRGTVTRGTVCCSLPAAPRAAMAELDEALNRGRQQEIEQSYWGLSGETSSDTELTLVGMMVDRAEIAYEAGRLIIRYTRNEGPPGPGTL